MLGRLVHLRGGFGLRHEGAIMTPYRTPPPESERHWFWRDAIIRRSSWPSGTAVVLMMSCWLVNTAAANMYEHFYLEALKQEAASHKSHTYGAYPIVPANGQNLPLGDLVGNSTNAIYVGPNTWQLNDAGYYVPTPLNSKGP